MDFRSLSLCRRARRVLPGLAFGTGFVSLANTADSSGKAAFSSRFSLWLDLLGQAGFLHRSLGRLPTRVASAGSGPVGRTLA